MSTPVRGGGGVPDGLIVGILGLLLGTTGAVWLATETAEFATRGHAPHPLRFSATPLAIRHLATAPNDLPGAWPATPAAQLPSATAFWLSFFLLLAALLALFLATLALRARLSAPRAAVTPTPRTGSTASRAWPKPHPEGEAPVAGLGERPGAAEAALADAPGPWGEAPGTTRSAAEPPDTSGAWGAAPAAERSGPAAAVPPARGEAPVARQGGGDGGSAAGGRWGVTCLLVPEVRARGAKRELLGEVARKASGALVVVSGDRALWEGRPPHRDCALYDPGHLLGDPGLAWAPQAGCVDPAVAAARARALLAPALRPGADGAAAEALLADWLHAAAREGRSIRQVARRAARPEAPEPVRAALACLEELHVLKSCLPSGSPQDSLDLDDVLRGRRPLYLLGSASETRVRAAEHSTMPLLTALLDSLLPRLAPGTTLVLDDIPALAPAPTLPHTLGNGGTGLTAVLTLRSFEQARARWSEDSVHSLWTGAERRGVLGADGVRELNET